PQLHRQRPGAVSRRGGDEAECREDAHVLEYTLRRELPAQDLYAHVMSEQEHRSLPFSTGTFTKGLRASAPGPGIRRVLAAPQQALVPEIQVLERLDGLRTRPLPEAAVDGLDQPLGHRAQGPGVLLLEEVLDVGVEQIGA